ncbi:MAG: hypothetical protein GEV04_12530 [Actinophytocola sp.]|nr:hypothetical protein [Actinophytocola sp.]
MMRTLLVRGLIAGLLAGLAAAVFAFFVGEPHVDAAIAFEEATAGHHAEEPLVSRDVQRTIGLLSAHLGIGLALGGLFSVVFAVVYGRLGGFSVRAYSALLAGAAFVAVTLVPFLKYPANPPAVGQAGTAVSRTELYFVFLALSVITAGLAVAAARSFADRFGGWAASGIGILGYTVVMTVCAVLMPPVNEVPDDFPATLLWDFRLASLGGLVVLWLVLGAAFGTLVHRALAHRALAEAPAVAA